MSTNSLRGGAWNFSRIYARAACRDGGLTGYRHDVVGLRVVCDVEPEPETSNVKTCTGMSENSLRGGAWSSNRINARAADRHATHPGARNDSRGLRVVCDVEPEPETSKIVRGRSWLDSVYKHIVDQFGARTVPPR